jgi:hypothetical protein
VFFKNMDTNGQSVTYQEPLLARRFMTVQKEEENDKFSPLRWHILLIQK